MSAPLSKILLLSLGWMGGISPIMAYPSPPPLQQKLAALHCATNAQSAQKILTSLNNITRPEQPWPDEWLGQKAESSLHAGLLDIALHTLKSTTERFPELREDAERIALQWNYCDVLKEQKFYNLTFLGKELRKQLAANDSPLQWRGFREWGFLTPDPDDRFVPLLLDEIRIAPSAYHLFLHQIYRQRCFPHPETGLLASEADAPPNTVLNQALALTDITEEVPQAYPFKWDEACEVVAKKPTPPTTKDKPPITKAPDDTPKSIATKTAKKDKPVTPQKRAPVQLAVNKETPNKGERQKSQKKPSEDRVSSPTVYPISTQPEPIALELFSLPQAVEALPEPLGIQGEIGTATEAEQLPPPPPVSESPPLAVASASLPAIMPIAAGGDIPMYIEEEDDTEDDDSTQQSHSTTGIIGTDKNRMNKGKKKGKTKKLRLAGSFADTISLKDGSNSVSASVTWSPKPNWFVSGNASFKDGALGYSWSGGYNDSKPGGWSAQINNWGPISPDEGLALDKAVVNIGKKIKSEKLTKHKLAASTNLSIPVNGKPSLSGTMQWNPKPNVYTRTTASIPLEGGTPNWNYVIGYSNPKPGGLKIEYSNYGKNDFPGDNLKDGAITVSKGWQF